MKNTNDILNTVLGTSISDIVTNGNDLDTVLRELTSRRMLLSAIKLTLNEEIAVLEAMKVRLALVSQLKLNS